MSSKNFEEVLNQIEHGYEIYMNLVNSLGNLVDEASELLSEEEYQLFKLYLKDKILEDL
jgi:hypothetical protein